MNHQEIYHLLKYRREELTNRMQSIKDDFSNMNDLDDILYTLAHETKVELANVKAALEQIEQGRYGLCEQCGQAIDVDTLTNNPFAKLCRYCKQKVER